jgi:hypothetical protein
VSDEPSPFLRKARGVTRIERVGERFAIFYAPQEFGERARIALAQARDEHRSFSIGEALAKGDEIIA